MGKQTSGWWPIERLYADYAGANDENLIQIILGWDGRDHRMPCSQACYFNTLSKEFSGLPSSIGKNPDAYKTPSHYQMLPEPPQ